MSDTSPTTLEHFRYRIRRDTHGVVQWFRGNWRERRWFRWLASLTVAGILLLAVGWVLLAKDLPDAETLLDYEPPLPTIVRGIDGEIVHSYARERRVQLQYSDFPQELIEAFLAAEDKTFFSHGGVDITGTLGAVFDYATKYGSGERAVGGSTITQQVAKNILLGNEYSVTRKLKELILARRIEDVLTMREIMEIILRITERKRMLVSLPWGLAKFQAMFLQFAPGALKLTPDQVMMLQSDNVVSDTAQAAGLTLEGLGIAPDSMEAVAPQYLWRFRAAGQFQRKNA